MVHNSGGFAYSAHRQEVRRPLVHSSMCVFIRPYPPMLHFCRKRRAHRAAQMRRKKKHVDARKELCNFCSSCELCAAMSFTHKWAKTESSSSSLHLYCWSCESAAMTFQVHRHPPFNRLSTLIIPG